MAYIYKITNDINGKVYVGKTEHSIERRFKEHCRDRLKRRCEKRPLYSAMNKYGIEHFHVELIESTNNPNEREAFWIDKFNSYHNGYNATKGGDGKKYLDYDLICNTYIKLQNVAETANILGISRDSVTDILNQRHIDIVPCWKVSAKKTRKSIDMYDGMQLIQSFSSVKAAARYLQQHNLTNIKDVCGITKSLRDCANGKRKQAYMRIWKWS